MSICFTKKTWLLTVIAILLALTSVSVTAHAASPKIVDFNPGTFVHKSDGSVWRFGFEYSVPTRVPISQPLQKIVLTDDNGFLALYKDGTVWSYPAARGEEPEQIIRLASITDIAGNGQSFLALKADGTVWSWGADYNGILGQGSIPYAMNVPPQQIPGLREIEAIAIAHTSVALNKQGEVFTWGGWPHPSRIHQGNPEGYRTSPLRVHNLPPIKAVDTHYTGVLALDEDGLVHTWGYNFLELQSPYLSDNTLHSPVRVPGIHDVRQIAMGASALFLKADGTVYEAGRSGLRPSDRIQKPHRLSSLSQIVKIGSFHSSNYALDAQGVLYGWGESTLGALGDGTYIGLTWNAKPTPILDTGTVIFDGVQQPYPGVIRHGVSLVPLRKLAEPLGATLGFEAQTKQVSISYDGQKISMTPGGAAVTINGSPTQISGPIMIYNNETYVPLRFVSQLFGAQVSWRPELAEMIVTTK